MKRDKILFSVIAVLIVLNLFSLGMLWRNRVNKVRQKPNRESSEPNRGWGFMYKDLDFSEEQRTRVGAVQRKHIVGMRELERAHLKLRRAYLDMALSPEYNEVVGDSLIDRMALLNAQMQERTWLLFRSIYEICSPTQQEKYRSLMLDANKRYDKRATPPVPFKKEGQ
jgi:Spy/CpxP family protein refolding chaperone